MNRRELTQLGALTAAVAWLPACVGGSDGTSLGPDPAGSSSASGVTETSALASGNGLRAFAPGGTSFVLAPLRNYVDVLDSYGTRITRIGDPFGVPTRGRGDVSGPIAAAWSAASGRFLILELGNARVQAFGPSGAALGILASVDRGSSDLAVDAKSGAFYVAASSTHRIQGFDASGRALGTIGRFGMGSAGLNGPASVALAPNGTLHVVDAGSASVKVFTTGGDFIGSYGGRGDSGAPLVGPRAVRFDGAGYAWVADTFGASVRVYDVAGRLQSRWSPRLGNGRPAAPVALSVRADGSMYAAVIAAS
jgi:DNA-binding beta-propeller fold protein YncE